MIIFDSSPLIHLTQIGKLKHIISIFKNLVIPQAVYEEVVEKGIKKNYSDAIIIQNHINNKEILIKKAVIPPFLQNSLHPGEREALALAINHKNEALLILDEKKARLIARENQVLIHGTLGVLLILVEENVINPNKYHSNLRLYADRGWISLRLYEKYRKEVKYNE